MKNFFKYVFATIIGIFGFFMILGIAFFIFLGLSALFSSNKVDIPNNGILEIKLEAPLFENASEAEPSFFSDESGSTVYYRQILKIIKQAKDDDKIKGISLNLSSVNAGITQENDIRNAIADFKSNGKFVYAYGVNMAQNAYYLATVADSIFLNPMGGVELKGLASEVVFYKNLGEKYGIDFQVIRHGKYKSAVEPFLRTDLSEENRLQISQLLDGIWNNIATDMSKSRKIDLEQLNIDADSLYGFIAEDALQHNLVDVLTQESDYHDFLKKKVGLDEDQPLELFSLRNYLPHLHKEKGSDYIAVIYASGNISDGEGDTGISSTPYKKMIRELTDDDNVKAVVLRVNSGGGSAIASDEILHELKKLQEKKHLVVSFGDVAASGGYYIAMAGEKIYAEPNTITGSIGVLGMLPSFEKLVNNIGITTDYVTTNTNSLVYSPLTTLSKDSKQMLTMGVETTYNRFLQVVSENRKMSVAEVDSLGQGRVWSGESALKNGLIDEMGTLDDAIAEVAKMAELEHYRIDSYPKPKDEFELFLRRMNNYSSAESVLKANLGEEEYKLYENILFLKNQQGAILYHPYTVSL